jgi:hypothetical protein
VTLGLGLQDSMLNSRRIETTNCSWSIMSSRRTQLHVMRQPSIQSALPESVKLLVLMAAMQRRDRMESHHTTGAKVNMKSWPGIWVKPFATKHALMHVMCLLLLHLMCRTHLHWTALQFGGRDSTSL